MPTGTLERGSDTATLNDRLSLDHLCGPGCDHSATADIDIQNDFVDIGEEGPPLAADASQIVGHECGPACDHSVTDGLDSQSDYVDIGGDESPSVAAATNPLEPKTTGHECGPGCDHSPTADIDTQGDFIAVSDEAPTPAAEAPSKEPQSTVHDCGPGCDHSATADIDTQNDFVAIGEDAPALVAEVNSHEQQPSGHECGPGCDHSATADIDLQTDYVDIGGDESPSLIAETNTQEIQPAGHECGPGCDHPATAGIDNQSEFFAVSEDERPSLLVEPKTQERATAQPDQESIQTPEPKIATELRQVTRIIETNGVTQNDKALQAELLASALQSLKNQPASPQANGDRRVLNELRQAIPERVTRTFGERVGDKLAARTHTPDSRDASRTHSRASQPEQRSDRPTRHHAGGEASTRQDRVTRNGAESSLRNLAPKQREVKVRELLKEKRGNIQRETRGKEGAPKTEKQIARREQTSQALQKSREARITRAERKDSIKQDIRTLRNVKGDTTQSRSPAVARKLERGAPAEKLRVTRDGRVVAGNRTERLKQNVASHRARVTELRGKPRAAVTPKQQANQERTARMLDRAREIRATKPTRAESSLRNLAPKQREAKIRTLLKEKRTAIQKELKSKENAPKTARQVQRRAVTSRMLNKARTRRVERLSKKVETKKSVRHAKVTERRGKELKRTQVRLKTLAAKKRPLSISKDGRVRVASRIERRGLKLKALPQKRLELRSASTKQLSPKQATRRLQRAAVTQRLRARAPERRPRLSPLPRAKRLPLIRKALTNKRAELQRLNRGKAPNIKPRTRNLLRRAQAKRALRTQNKKQLQKRVARVNRRVAPKKELTFSKDAASLFTQLELMQGKKRRKKLGSNRDDDGDLLEEEQAAMEVAELLHELTLLGDKPEEESKKEDPEQPDAETETSQEQDSKMFVSASNEGPKAELDILLVKQIDDTGSSDDEDSELAKHMAKLQESLTRELMASPTPN